ncbi:TUT7, partial [Symbiodinium sp. CCMP2592]
MEELDGRLRDASGHSNLEEAAKRINSTLNEMASLLGLDGAVRMYGSFCSGIKTGCSDLDLTFLGDVEGETAISILQKFEKIADDFGFHNITKIHQANLPLLKLTDREENLEVDLCVNNELGIRNSLLLDAYCRYDVRVLQLGCLVKDWAKGHDIVGTADGFLNSYAFMLLVVFFLQTTEPPVVPNLQSLECDPVPVLDRKWGDEFVWETKFFSNVHQLPKSQNTMSIGELLLGFFQFYTQKFDSDQHAVSIRLQKPGQNIDKYSLMQEATKEKWYLEDPFDLKHNLAGACSRAGRRRIGEVMQATLQWLISAGRWTESFPEPSTDFFLKCRVSQELTPDALLEEFGDCDLVKLHFPKLDGLTRTAQAFLQFRDASARRRAHAKNEKYLLDCQLQLFSSTRHGFSEAAARRDFVSFDA